MLDALFFLKMIKFETGAGFFSSDQVEFHYSVFELIQSFIFVGQ